MAAVVLTAVVAPTALATSLAPSPVVSVTITAPAEVFTPEVAQVTVRPGDENVPLTYTWMRDGVPIDGAIYSTYNLGYIDIGTELSVSVSTTSAGYDSTPVTSNSVAATGPYLGGDVSIVGNDRGGSTVQVVTSGWPAITTSFKYEWFITDAGYPHETAFTVLGRSTSFTLPVSAEGRYVYVLVQGYAPNFRTPTDIWFNSSLVKIEPEQFASVSAPTISGRAKVGDRLTASPGSASPATGNSVRYQWFSSATPGGVLTAIAGATSSSYVPSGAMADRYISVRAITSRAYYASVAVYSVATDRVIPAQAQLVKHSLGQSHNPDEANAP